jgi:hypothetical protein
MRGPAPASAISRVAISLPALFIAGLLFYKWKASLIAIQKVWSSGVLSVRTDVVGFDRIGQFAVALPTLNYFAVIWPALAFGILISAGVRAFIPPEWISGLFGGRWMRGQFTAGAAGAPLMLCSCCIAPVFSTVYERSSRLAPSVALMLASPSLNPAALILTFVMFSPKIAAARLLMAVIAVLFGGSVIERMFASGAPLPVPREEADRVVSGGVSESASAFFRSLWYIVLRTIPALAVGVVCSMLLIQYVPKEFLASNGFRRLAVITTALIATPLALPTFFEIPLALGLLAAGAPAGAAAALLFAGPAVNLPSLLTVAKSTNWKIATALGILVWVIASAGGLLLLWTV